MRDLEAAMRTYVDDYGIGPWEIYEFNPGNVKDLREYGEPVERSWRGGGGAGRRGNGVVLSGEFSGIRVAYLATDRDLGVITEIFSGTPRAEQKPDAT